MFSLNPRSDCFEVVIADSFWIPDIVKKYKNFLTAMPFPMSSIDDIVWESFQKIEIPGAAQQIITQTQGTGTGNETSQNINYPGYESKQTTIGKDLTLTFRMLDSYLNWMLFFEHFWTKLRGDKKDVSCDIIVIVKSNNLRVPMFYAVFKNAIFTSIDSLPLDYTNQERSIESFNLGFTIDKFEVNFLPPVSGALEYDEETGTLKEVDQKENNKEVVIGSCKPSLLS